VSEEQDQRSELEEQDKITSLKSEMEVATTSTGLSEDTRAHAQIESRDSTEDTHNDDEIMLPVSALPLSQQHSGDSGDDKVNTDAPVISQPLALAHDADDIMQPASAQPLSQQHGGDSGDDQISSDTDEGSQMLAPQRDTVETVSDNTVETCVENAATENSEAPSIDAAASAVDAQQRAECSAVATAGVDSISSAGSTIHSAEHSTVVTSDGVSNTDDPQKPADSVPAELVLDSKEVNSDQHAVDNKEVNSDQHAVDIKEVKSAVVVDSKEVKSSSSETEIESVADQSVAEPQSKNARNVIDWDALGKPKPKSSDVENVEFNQVFKRLVKHRAEAEGTRDLQSQRAETESGKDSAVVSSPQRMYASPSTKQDPASDTLHDVSADAKTDKQTTSSRAAQFRKKGTFQLNTPGAPGTKDKDLIHDVSTSKAEAVAAASTSQSDADKLHVGLALAVASGKDEDFSCSASSSNAEAHAAESVAAVASVTQSHEDKLCLDTASVLATTARSVEPLVTADDSSHGKLALHSVAAAASSVEEGSQSTMEDLPATQPLLSVTAEDKSCDPRPPMSSDASVLSVDAGRAYERKSINIDSPSIVLMSVSQLKTPDSKRPSTVSVPASSSVSVSQLKQKDSDDSGRQEPDPNFQTSTEAPPSSVSKSTALSMVQPKRQKATGTKTPTTASMSASSSVTMSQLKQDEETSGGQETSVINPVMSSTEPVSKPAVSSAVKQKWQSRGGKVSGGGRVQPADMRTEEPAWVLTARHNSDLWTEDRAEQFDRKPLSKPAPAADDDEVRSRYHLSTAYLRSLLNYHTPTCSLRSANTNLLSVPRVRTTFASRGFSIAAPTVWNSLPSRICSSTSADTFRRLLKTRCFQQAYCSP